VSITISVGALLIIAMLATLNGFLWGYLAHQDPSPRHSPPAPPAGELPRAGYLTLAPAPWEDPFPTTPLMIAAEHDAGLAAHELEVRAMIAANPIVYR
jgi:hypothetical protein